MSLQQRLKEDLKTAMKAGDTLRVSVIRMSLSEIRNAEIEKGSSLADDEVVQVLTRESKKRRDSIDQFQRGGRPDLAEKEEAELQILNRYLPEQMDEAVVTDIAREVISELHATSRADKGRVMSALMPRIRGRADGKLVSQVVDRLLDANST